MGANTHIQWCDHSFNGWIGCTKISPGCANCYAEVSDKNRFSRTLGGTKEEPQAHWGKGAPRYKTRGNNWQQPLKWNRDAEKSGVRARVFCASFADVFDAEVPDEWRDELFALIARTPHLDWLLLTKRPEEAARYLAVSLDGSYPVPDRATRAEAIANACNEWEGARVRVADEFLMNGGFNNVWLGASVENQKTANERVPILLQIPAMIHFLSMEPLLESVRLWDLRCGELFDCEGAPYYNALGGFSWWGDGDNGHRGPKIDWMIIGGESGIGARGFNLNWARDLISQAHGPSRKTAVFVKQLGAAPYEAELDEWGAERNWREDYAPSTRTPLQLRDKKGGEMSEWPEDLRVRELPEVSL